MPACNGESRKGNTTKAWQPNPLEDAATRWRNHPAKRRLTKRGRPGHPATGRFGSQAKEDGEVRHEMPRDETVTREPNARIA